MNYNTSIAGATGVIDNHAMGAGGPGIRSDAMPVQIRKIDIDNIIVGDRVLARRKDAELEALVADIRQHGLLHAIGVQQNRGTNTYTLIYGRRRLMAWQEGWRGAQKLLAERGTKDAEAIAEARAWQAVPCIVYDADMPKSIALLKELAENMFRRALTKSELEEHRVKYAAILKRLELVVSAHDKREENKAKARKGRSSDQSPDETDQSKPTTMEKLTTDLGIQKAQVSRDFASISRRAQGVAKATGMDVPKPITTESTADQIEEVVALAELQTEAKKEAEQAGTDPRKAMPAQPSADNVVTVRVDVTDPARLLEWFQMKLKDTNKPLRMPFLRGLHQGLGRLIAEHKLGDR